MYCVAVAAFANYNKETTCTSDSDPRNFIE